MAHFYGTVQGNRGEASRTGSKNSGMGTYCASWNGAIRCFAYINNEGIDCVRVEKTLWHGEGEYKLLYDGEIGKKEVPEEIKG